MNLEVIYEDEFLICVSKPNNVLVHHSYHSRNKSEENSLLQLLDQQIGGTFYPIHRLDRKTSGIILLAKKTSYVAKFQELFTNNQIQKTYFGVVRGHAPSTKIIDTPVKGRDGKVHKEALTHLKTIETVILEIPVKPYDTSRYSLVELQPKTGRMHQLRVHMTKISHPLIGDAKYGDKNHDMMFLENFGWGNLFLHAKKLEFTHPFTNENLKLSANFPKDWTALFDAFNWDIKPN